jgi:hypothetical protein
MVRLLERAQATSHDPELFAGLTHVCRYSGLLEASLAAHDRGHRLDPHLQTSVAHTHFMRQDYALAIEFRFGDIGYIDALALAQLSQQNEAIQLLLGRLDSRNPREFVQYYGSSLLALLEGRREDSMRQIEYILECNLRDPEGIFYLARQMAYLGEHRRALELLDRAVKGGYTCFLTLTRDPWLDALRGDQAFGDILRATEADYHTSEQAFIEAGGERVLGIRPA